MLPKIPIALANSCRTTIQVVYSPNTPFPVPESIEVRDANGIRVGVAKNLAWDGGDLEGEIHYDPGFSTEFLLDNAQLDSLPGQDSVS
jgi:hypothetical protein